MGDSKQEQNNKEFASGYARGRSGDGLRDTLNDCEDHDSQEYKGYVAGMEDRWKYGYKPQEECNTGESKSDDGGSSCFLTTACVQAQGLGDNCSILNELRVFRDTYVATLPSGASMLREYYSTAPMIVSAVNRSANRHREWQRIFTEISSIVDLIRRSRYDDAVTAYGQLFERLQSSYGRVDC